MLFLYESLRKSDHWQSSKSPLTFLQELEWPEQHPSRVLLSEYEANANNTEAYRKSSEEALLSALEGLKAKFAPLEARVKKFRQRLAEKDPITQAPRYGSKTAERVTNVLVLHGALKKATWAAYGLEVPPLDNNDTAGDTSKTTESTTAASASTSTTSVVSSLRSAVEAQQEAQRQAAEKADLERQKEEDERRAAEKEKEMQEEVERQQRAAERAAEEADLARRAEQVRQAQRREQEAAAQAERDWIASIPKGPEGVKQQIQILKDDTEADPAAQKAALSALLVLFTQIAQHPEEINFRKIRRDHPKFHQDIGRHKGGREIFIAAGFKLMTLDEIPCFYSKEPNLETDMDAWSDWFDGIKSNLAVVKEMQ